MFERNLVSEESLTMSLAREATSGERVITGGDLEENRGAAPARGARGGLGEDYLETLNVLVTLLENTRADLRGHSAQVARLMRRISERIGVSEFVLVGARGRRLPARPRQDGRLSPHVAQRRRVRGPPHLRQKQYKAPLRLLEAVRLPAEAAQRIEHMYERYDGQGFPDKLSGKEIPLGARLLAIADTYADLTQNPRNPFRKALRPVQACEVLERYKGTIFDPNLVDIFKHTVTGEELKARLLANRHRALIVDPDPEETTVLELRMLEQGFEVQQARSARPGAQDPREGRDRDRRQRARARAGHRRLQAARARAQAGLGANAALGVRDATSAGRSRRADAPSISAPPTS